jgi:2-keto-4-pentenoate hydratase/2-oxohepta-3-ene-1,7-dioic acid hydratase in catechol pathway
MRRLARSGEGSPLLGDRDGFVPLSTVAPEFNSVTEALQSSSGKLPDPSDAAVPKTPAEEISFRLPLETLGKLWYIGMNYQAQLEDFDQERPDSPTSFMKPSTAAVGPGGPIKLPPTDLAEKITAEAELGLVIGKECKAVSEERVTEVVAGFVPVIDVTAVDVIQKNPRFLTRAKCFDSFTVIGPWIHLPETFESVPEFRVSTRINDETVETDLIKNTIFSPSELVTYHSRHMTLKPGDIISTGGPRPSEITSGDHIEAVIDPVGSVSASIIDST